MFFGVSQVLRQPVVIVIEPIGRAAGAGDVEVNPIGPGIDDGFLASFIFQENGTLEDGCSNFGKMLAAIEFAIQCYRKFAIITSQQQHDLIHLPICGGVGVDNMIGSARDSDSFCFCPIEGKPFIGITPTDTRTDARKLHFWAVGSNVIPFHFALVLADINPKRFVAHYYLLAEPCQADRKKNIETWSGSFQALMSL